MTCDFKIDNKKYFKHKPHKHHKSPKPKPTPQPSSIYPITVLPELNKFALQLPISETVGGSPIKINTPGSFIHPDWFYVNSSNNAVKFIVDIDLIKSTGKGATTANSVNLRTELREQTPGWSLADTTLHILEVTLSVDELIGGGTVVTQVHGPGPLPNMEMELINGFFQIQDHKNAKGTPNSNIGNLNTTPYILGTKVNIKVVCGNNLIKFYYNGELSPLTISGSYDKQYFKTGNYLQGQKSGEKAVVSIYNLSLT